MTDLAAILDKLRDAMPLTAAEIEALADRVAPKPPLSVVLAERRRMIFDLTAKHWPRRPGEFTWWKSASAVHQAFRSYAPGTWKAGEWGNGYGDLAGCPHTHGSLESALWAILKHGPIEEMPETTQGYLKLLRREADRR